MSCRYFRIFGKASQKENFIKCLAINEGRFFDRSTFIGHMVALIIACGQA